MGTEPLLPLLLAEMSGSIIEGHHGLWCRCGSSVSVLAYLRVKRGHHRDDLICVRSWATLVRYIHFK